MRLVGLSYYFSFIILPVVVAVRNDELRVKILTSYSKFCSWIVSKIGRSNRRTRPQKSAEAKEGEVGTAQTEVVDVSKDGVDNHAMSTFEVNINTSMA